MSFRVKPARQNSWLLISAIALVFAFSSNPSAHADGCWGSSHGGWGSGGSMGGGSYGSYGCRGGLFSNAPVRSLISRVGVGVGNGISLLGNGISNIFDRRPGMFGSHGGWGSSGGSTGYGSSGGWGHSGWGSNGSTGCVGTWSQPVYAAPVYSAPVYPTAHCDTLPVSTIAPAISSDCCGGTVLSTPTYGSPTMSTFTTGGPVLDYGYMGTQSGIIGAPTDAVMVDGVMMTAPTTDFQTAPGIGTTDSYYDPESDRGSGEDDGFGADDAEEDDVDGDSTTYVPAGKAILTLDVPADARVYVNDRLTKTKGTRRSYASKNLKAGQQYRYRVKVVSEVDGKEVVKSKVIRMRGGETNLVAFNFQPITTRVVVSVPEDAKVVIDGHETNAEGTYRSFATDKLTSGKWEDYSVEVSVVRNGQTMTRTEKFDLAAGEFRFLEFEFDQAAAGSIAKK